MPPRPLLPAISIRPSPYGTQAPPPQPLDKNERSACSECRRSKRACDGQQPACGACRKRRKDCVYGVHRRHQLKRAQDQLHQATDLLGRLKSLPERDALTLLQQIRSGQSPGMQAAPAYPSPLSTQRPSDHLTARGLLPQTEFTFEFETTALHGSMYQILLPLNMLNVNFSPFDKLPPLSSTSGLRQTLVEATRYPSPFTTPTESFRQQQSAEPDLLGPPSPLELCDARLAGLDIGYWSKAPVTNECAASLISSYLRTHHTMTVLFDADLFLDDLIAQRTDFCSHFLVASILLAASASFFSPSNATKSLSSYLRRDALRFFEAEQCCENIINVAATNVYCLATYYVRDMKLAERLMHTIRSMSRAMNLIDTDHRSHAAMSLRQLPLATARATAYVAWGAYVMLSTHNFHWRDSTMRWPPALPIPGSEPGSYFRYTNKAFVMICRFFTLWQEVSVVYYANDPQPIADRVPLSFAESKYQRLLQWSDSMDYDLTRQGLPSSQVLLFHMWLHAAVLQIFQPFMPTCADRRLASFTSTDASPRAVFAASLNQLKRLLVVYRMCDAERDVLYSPFVNTCLMAVANSVCRAGGDDWQGGGGMTGRRPDNDDDEWRFYFMLCVRFWQVLYQAYPVFIDVAQAFLSMAIEGGRISGAEAQELLQEIRARGGHGDALGGGSDGGTDDSVESARGSSVGSSGVGGGGGGGGFETAGINDDTTLIVDYETALTDADEARCARLASKFEEVSLIDEFIVQGPT